MMWRRSVGVLVTALSLGACVAPEPSPPAPLVIRTPTTGPTALALPLPPVVTQPLPPPMTPQPIGGSVGNVGSAGETLPEEENQDQISF